MRSHFVSNPRQYHEALAKRFESRKASLTKKQLRGVLQTLGFDININSINQASSGNMSRVYLTPDLAIKIRDMKLASKKVHHFLANKVASETFYPKLPVPHVLAYDLFKKLTMKS